MSPTYNDDFSGCSETYATLRIYHAERSPEAVTSELEVEPTDQQCKGDFKTSHKRPVPINGWFLSSQGEVESCDCRRHIDWITAQLEGKGASFRRLEETSHEFYISCFWVSTNGNGGPKLSPDQMTALVALGLEVNWDIYFDGDEYDAET